MDEAIRRLRSQAQQLARGKARWAIRYPPEFHVAAVAVARAQLDRGVPRQRVARELGVPAWSLARWLQQSGPARVRPVTIAPEPARSRSAATDLVLMTRQGVRVEGLDRETLIAVLRALA
jgi:transposase-like protein